MQKKILIVAESIDVEDSSGSKANVALINNLYKLGYDLKVYHYTRKKIKLGKIPSHAIEENRRSLLFYLSRIERYTRNYLRLKLNRPIENVFGFSFTLLNDRNSIIHGLRRIYQWEPDLVITLSKGGSFRPHHALLNMPKLHQKWLAYIHDPYPMHWYPPPYPWFEPGHKQKQEFMQNIALSCSITAFPSQLLQEWMGKKFPPFSEKGVVIPHQIDRSSSSDAEQLPRFIDPAKFNLVHAGNLIQGREPFGILEGFKKFLEDNPAAKEKVRLIFLGGRNYYSSLLNEYEKQVPQFVHICEVLQFSAVQKIQRLAAVNLILEAKSEISPFLPGKFAHCVQADRPIFLLSPEKSEAKRLLGGDYPYHSEIDNPVRILEVVSLLYRLWEKNPAALSLNRPDLEDYLSTDHLKEKMKDVFAKIPT